MTKTSLVCAWSRFKPAHMFNWRCISAIDVMQPTQVTACRAPCVRTHWCGFVVSVFFPAVHFVFQQLQWRAQFRVSLPRRVLVKISHATCGISSWKLFHEQVSSILPLFIFPIDLAKMLSLFMFLWIHCLGKNGLTFLHDASSGSIACGSAYYYVAPLSLSLLRSVGLSKLGVIALYSWIAHGR